MSKRLLFLREDFADVLHAQALAFHQDFRKDVLRLAERESEGGLQEALAAGGVEVDGNVLELRDVGQNLVKEGGQFLARREREVQDGDFLLQLDGDFEQGRNEHDGLVAVLEVQGDFLEAARDGEARLAQERVQILEQVHGRLDVRDDLVERGQRLAGGRVARFGGLHGRAGQRQTGGAAPFVSWEERKA